MIYLRHTATEPSQVDAAEIDLEDCGTQQNLSAIGRSQAQAIGIAFAQLRIPVGEVWSSPLCRCAYTAQIAFGRMTLDPELMYRVHATPTEQADHRGALIELLSATPAAGTNTVIVSDGDTFAATVGGTLEEGEAAVIVPERPGRFRLLARVRVDDWGRLLQASTSPGATSVAP